MCLVFQIEQQLAEIEQFSVATNRKPPKGSKCSSGAKDREKEKHIPGLRKHLIDSSRREAAASKRMQDLMRHFSTILNQASPLILCFKFIVKLMLCLRIYLLLDIFFIDFSLLICPSGSS